MKFIIPRNYKYNSKILGFLDYITAFIDLIIGVILYFLISLVIKNIRMKIYFFISLFLPVILFSIFGTGGENIIYFSIYIIKFLKNRRVYFYSKNKK